mgnify:CR=1 FL=1
MNESEKSFPIFMLSFCIISDFIRAVLGIIPVTLPAAVILGLFMGFIVLIWTFSNLGLSGVKDQKLRNKIAKKTAARMVLNLAGGMLPFFDLFPWNSFTVISVWRARNAKK